MDLILAKVRNISERDSKKDEKSEKTLTLKINNNLLRNKELSNFQKKVDEYFTNLSTEDAIHLPPSELLENFESYIADAAFDVAGTKKETTPSKTSSNDHRNKTNLN